MPAGVVTFWMPDSQGDNIRSVLLVERFQTGADSPRESLLIIEKRQRGFSQYKRSKAQQDLAEYRVESPRPLGLILLFHCIL